MSKILLIDRHNKIKERDIDLERGCLKDYLYDILKGEFTSLNKEIDGIECIFFYNSWVNYEDFFLDDSIEKNMMVIVKSDLLKGYIDIEGNYVCYYGFSNDEIFALKKHIIIEKNKFLNIDNKNEIGGKYLIYVDSYSKIKELFINKHTDTIKELVNNILGNNPYTIPFKINNLECSIWFNSNKKGKINEAALNILDVGYIRGEFILTKYCRDYNYIIGKGCYTLDDGFNNVEKNLVLNYIKDS